MKVIEQSAEIITTWSLFNLYARCELAGRISHATEDRIAPDSAEPFVRRMVKKRHESVFEFARVMWMTPEDGGTPPFPKRAYSLRKLRELVNQTEGKATRHELMFARSVANTYPAFFDDVGDWFWNTVNIPEEEGDLFQWEEEPIDARNFFVKGWIPVHIITNRAISHQLVRYRNEVVYLQASQRYIKQEEEVDFVDPKVYLGDDTIAYALWSEVMEKAERAYIKFLSAGYPAQAARLVLPNSAATKLIMYASPDTWRHVFEQRISDKADPMIQELLIPLKEQFDKEGLL